jgi:hypothetical protein
VPTGRPAKGVGEAMGAGHIQTKNTPSKQVPTEKGAEQSWQKKGKGKWTANSMIGGHLLISHSQFTKSMCFHSNVC